MTKLLKYLLLLLAVFALGFFFGGHRERSRLQVVTDCDTIVRMDTIRLTEFREVERRVTDTMFVKLPASEKSASDNVLLHFADVRKMDSASDTCELCAKSYCSTIVVQDSVKVALPRETVVYKDSLYAVQISGYKPQLDWIQLTTPTTTIERTTRGKTRQSRWSFGVTAGVGVVGNGSGLHSGVGVAAGVTYRF